MPRKATTTAQGSDRGGQSGGVPQRGQHELLENEYRAQIVQILREVPGLNKSQLARLVDTSLTVASFHIGRLVDGGLLVGRPSVHGRDEHLFFLAEDEDLWTNERTRVLYGREGARRIGLYIADHPAATSEDIANDIGLTQDGVRWHLRTLEENGLVVSALADTYRVEYFPLYHLREWAKRFGDAYQWLEK